MRFLPLFIVASLASMAAFAVSDDAERVDAAISDGFDSPSADGRPSGWKPVRFRQVARQTEYRLAVVDRRTVLEAHSDRSSSALVWEREFDPNSVPILSWDWKTVGPIPGENIASKSGDDLAARVLVMFPYDPEQVSAWTRMLYGIYRAFYGEYPPGGALSYVWSSKLPAGQVLNSAFTSRLRHVVVAGADAPPAEWRTESRDIAKDFGIAFPGETLPVRARIGIMVDTDNTGAVMTSWFDDLRLAGRMP